ncbi:MAG: Imm40 family immunity protein [Acidobacteriota bacterium]
MPAPLSESSLDLREIGILNYAWPLNVVQSIVDLVHDRRVLMLGADTFVCDDGQIDLLYEIWSFRKSPERCAEDQLKENGREAKDFISRLSREHKGCFVAFVLENGYFDLSGLPVNASATMLV